MIKKIYDYEKNAFFLSIIIHLFLLSLINNYIIKEFKKGYFISNVNEKYKIFSTKNLDIVNIKSDPKPNNLVENTETLPPPPYCGDIFETFKISSQSISLEKPKIIEEKITEIETTEIIDANLKKLPKYMDYYWLVRSKISKTAHNLYKGDKTGYVVLNFTLNNDGNLLNVVFLKKSEIEILNEIALKSIYEASPFPPFPKELQNKKNLPFNVAIHFKNG